MLKIDHLSHSFGRRQVLFDIDFEVAEGEIVVVMGSSGGGKTTLLKCVAGLLPIEEGDVIVDGVSVRQDPETARAKMGMVFQYAALFDYLNVADNVAFGVKRQKGLVSKAARQLVGEQLEAVGLEGSEALMPAELSGGMRKRVGLARALAMEPKVLLYDEPTSGLDPVTAYSIDQLIVETRERTRTTSIVVSHDVTSVFRVADRIAFLDKGRLLFLGTPQEFRAAQDKEIQDLVTLARSEQALGTFSGPTL
ncbi:MAG: ATP-binding cassette domain-containing protein [Armatimonadetes bacterium]|nr:ATP-binding cassette domain-containing protein [Armatimonadota bacterium]